MYATNWHHSRQKKIKTHSNGHIYLKKYLNFFVHRPVLCCAFQDPIHVWSGCLEGKLKSFDINSNQEAVIGQHDNAIRCIEYSNDVNAVCILCI